MTVASVDGSTGGSCLPSTSEALDFLFLLYYFAYLFVFNLSMLMVSVASHQIYY